MAASKGPARPPQRAPALDGAGTADPPALPGVADGPASDSVWPAEDGPAARAGERFGPWALVREIGAGGMGSVWLAERADGAFQRQVALKLPRSTGNAALAERLRRERAIGARLEHPNIARLYDAGVDGSGRPFIAMEHVEGVAIDRHCRDHGLGLRARLRLFLQVVQAVAYAHAQLVAHGDLKPANVLVSGDGRAHLLDFGIAQLLGPDTGADRQGVAGLAPLLTPRYAAPEQMAGQAPGVLSDIYSLGLMLQELLTGTLPPGGEPAGAAADEKRLARAMRGELGAIVRKALQWQPQARYASAPALLQDLEDYLAGAPVQAVGGGAPYRLRKFVVRHWGTTAALVALLIALSAGSAIVAVQVHRAAGAAERERLVRAFVGEIFRADLGAVAPPASAALEPGRTAAGGLLVEQGAALIGARFSGDAAGQAELFAMLASLCAEMGAYRHAADYAGRHVLLVDALGDAAEARAAGRLQLAQALFADGRAAAAESEARTALALADDAPSLVRDAQVLLARVLFARGQLDEARSWVAQVERRRSGWLLRQEPADAWIEALRAEDLLAQNRPQEALPHYAQAVEMALRSEGPTSAVAIEIRLLAARWLRSLGERENAARFFDPAVVSLRDRGGAHATRAAFESARHAWALYSVGAAIPFDEAVQVIGASRAELSSQGDHVPPSMRDQIDFWLGEVMLDWGDVEGAAHLMQPVAGRLLAAALLPQEQFELATAMGYLARDSGRHREADDWFRVRLGARKSSGQGQQPYAANDFVLLAENLSMAGRHDEAEAVLAAAPKLEAVQLRGWRTDKYDSLLRETHARILLDRGQPSAALAALPQRSIDDHDNSAGLVSLRVLRGEALCRTGRTGEGLELLARQIKVVARDAHPNKPELAWLRATAAACARDGGDETRAQALEEQARAALGAQPQVAGYYRAALRPR